MTDLSHFPITQKWPAQHADRIQLYSLPTPNGVKAVSYTHLRAHETLRYLVCRLLLEKKKYPEES